MTGFGPSGRRKRSILSKRIKRESNEGKDSHNFNIEESNCAEITNDGEIEICEKQRSSAAYTIFCSFIFVVLFSVY